MVLIFLPDEIISDILLRLPVKSLIRFTAVCKPWESKIKSSKFIHTHLDRAIETNNQRGTHLVLYQSRNKPDEEESNEVRKQEEFSLHYDNNGFEEYCKIDFQSFVREPGCHFLVAGVCNGVICLVAKFGKYVLWNPSIKKVVILPSPTVCFKFNCHGILNDIVAIGFDALTTDYKVVRIVSFPFTLVENGIISGQTLAGVYSLGTGSWRSLGAIASTCDVFPHMSDFTNVFFNGAIHWVVRRDNGSSIILTFDVGSEVFGEIMMPKRGMELLVRTSRLSVTGDGKSLAVFTIGQRHTDLSPFLNVWVMKEYGVQESWTKLMTLSLQRGIRRVPRALSFRKSGEVFFLQSNGYESNEDVFLGSLDLGSKKINHPDSSKIETFLKYCLSVNPYEESLVLLDACNAVSY